MKALNQTHSCASLRLSRTGRGSPLSTATAQVSEASTHRGITIYFIYFYTLPDSRVANCDNSISLDIYDHFPFALAKMPCGHKRRRSIFPSISPFMSVYFISAIFFFHLPVPLIVVVVGVVVAVQFVWSNAVKWELCAVTSSNDFDSLR